MGMPPPPDRPTPKPRAQRLAGAREIAKAMGDEFQSARVLMLAAALAFYALLGLAPMVFLAITTLGFFLGDEAAAGTLAQSVSEVAGPRMAEMLEAMILAADRAGGNVLLVLAAVAMAVFGATTVFVQIQEALNVVWEAAAVRGRGLRYFLWRRAVSLAMVLGVGLLLAAAFVTSAVVSAAIDFLPGPSGAWRAGSALSTLVLLGVAFGALYHWVPDVRMERRHAFIGGLATAVLVATGMQAVSLLLARNQNADAYGGAASAVILLLLWFYYVSLAFLVGAIFTKVYVRRHGGERLEPGARRVRRPLPRPTG